MSETLEERGELVGHKGWVTALACPQIYGGVDRIVTASRDKTLLYWALESYTDHEGKKAIHGRPIKRLHGHSHHVQDVAISSDGQFALSGSWDKTLRLWDLKTGLSSRTFVGHTKDVLSVGFSPDNRQIISGSRDKTIRIWNTLGECKVELGPEQSGHTDWVSCVRFSPDRSLPSVMSCGWDKKVKIWNLDQCQLKSDLIKHTGYVNAITFSPDGSLCASGGKDGLASLWDVVESKELYSLDTGDIIHAMCFCPNHYWICVANQSSVKIYDLETKNTEFDIKPLSFDAQTSKSGQQPYCVSLTWSHGGEYLFGGYTDGIVRVWEAVPADL